jgi:hypothetical protein
MRIGIIKQEVNTLLYVRYKDHEGKSRVCPFDEFDLEPATNQ